MENISSSQSKQFQPNRSTVSIDGQIKTTQIYSCDNEEKEEEKEGKAKGNCFISNYHKFYEEIDQFLQTISTIKNNQNPDQTPPEIPDSVGIFVKLFQEEIAKCDCSQDHGKWCDDSDEGSSVLEAVGKISNLTQALGSFSSDPNYATLLARTNEALQRTMAFFEEEFRWLLEDSQKTDPDRRSFHESEVDADSDFPGFPPETVSQLSMIAKAMIEAGFETECCQVFSIARRNSFEERLVKIGFGKISAEDIQKMPWGSMEVEIATWIQACRGCIKVFFSGERSFCEAVFADHTSISGYLFGNLARCIVIQLLNFSETVAMTERTAEKLFKFFDMYEVLRDLAPVMNDLPELKSEISSSRGRIAEAAIAMFSDLENSIKNDHGRTPVPAGAVHPLTRYVMNYLKYACEYNDTVGQLFQEGQEPVISEQNTESDNDEKSNHSPFSVQLMTVMELLDANLVSKSKLYKDPSLGYIFLMNNGQYIMRKIKGSAEIHDLLGDNWRRKRSSEFRQCHKNYQRETWSKILGCFKEEGLQQGRGNVVKSAVKERFKTFNAMFEEIHKTQSSWVVSDEQMQSELRVSIGAVVIPAYRSFLGRYRQYLEGNRQWEKYIKYGPEDLETFIDDLFDGTPSSMVRRRT
ncbi:exocyst complex component EXO70B1-like [Magnolia sinica]|uniref:exocyst complex component EXO70B1-like n=1 Tax=Magnolia sinica TaxID=86752 RepID=UPI0026598154|nr:exocyst complex component EXO70B1-like [Magnolia sinica]